MQILTFTFILDKMSDEIRINCKGISEYETRRKLERVCSIDRFFYPRNLPTNHRYVHFFKRKRRWQIGASKRKINGKSGMAGWSNGATLKKIKQSGGEIETKAKSTKDHGEIR